jgi:predicted transcriptional regulator
MSVLRNIRYGLLSHWQHVTSMLEARSSMRARSSMEVRMMVLQKSESDRSAIDQVIHQHPGVRPSEIARELHVSRSTVLRRLPSLEETGHYYSEDDRGGHRPLRK